MQRARTSSPEPEIVATGMQPESTPGSFQPLGLWPRLICGRQTLEWLHKCGPMQWGWIMACRVSMVLKLPRGTMRPAQPALVLAVTGWRTAYAIDGVSRAEMYRPYEQAISSCRLWPQASAPDASSHRACERAIFHMLSLRRRRAHMTQTDKDGTEPVTGQLYRRVHYSWGRSNAVASSGRCNESIVVPCRFCEFSIDN